ncbi:MAG TPA: histidinol dehydrogenase, partial [Nitrososphaera sp.]|nr:histidinol dehydrogenase [Nitrososphaera sp.]
MKVFRVSDPAADASGLRKSSLEITESLAEQTRSIFQDVASHGDSAVIGYTAKFDGVSLDKLGVSPQEISAAYQQVPASQVKALKLMKERLARSERALLTRLKGIAVRAEGTTIRRNVRPIPSVGCYIPGGKARYPSTLVMCAVPAKIAGVGRIVAISPPTKDGTVDPLTLVAADICGVNEFYKIGGAQGIAALALGTESIKPVSKIVGPGGMFVTAAKLAASGRVSTDMVAGPTELLVYCDESAEARLVALDLISQAEHSPDTVCGIVTTSEALASDVASQVKEIIGSSLERSEIVR